MNLELRKAFPFIRLSKQSASQTLRPIREGSPDNMLPSLGLAYFLENNVSVFADIVLTLKQEVIRRGLVWKPRFAIKCLLCGTEYTEEKTQCDCGSTQLRKPDRTQINKFKNPRGESFVDTANLNDQNLETISGEMVRHWIVGDSGYVLCIKNYAYISNGIEEQLVATPVEFLTLDPREIIPIRQKNGLLGGKVWVCAIHRGEYAEHPGICKVCGHEMHEVLYKTAGAGFYDNRGVISSQGKTNYYIKDEIFNTSIYYPSISGGYPPILRMLYDAYAYHYMELRTYNYHKKGRPPGFLAFPTSNLDSLNTQWNALLAQAQEDPDNVQALGFDPGNGKGVATFVKLMSDPGAEMLEVKKDLRERMGSMFGVSMIFQADTSASGGLNNEGLQITVTNRSVEFLQNPFNGREQNNYKGGLYYWMVSQCGITDFVLHLLPSEEQDEMAEKVRFNQDAQNAKLMLDMGYDVKFENNKFTFSGVAKKAEPAGMFGGMPAPGPAQIEAPRASGEPDTAAIAAVGKSDIKKEEPDELDEYVGDQLIKDFAADAIKAIRQGALYSFYADVSPDLIPGIHEIIKDAFISHRMSLKEMIEKMQALGLDYEKARMIARTESTGVAMKAREVGWRRMEDARGEQFKYKAVITNDHRTAPISKRIKAAVDREGGAVSLDRLKQIYKTESQKPYIKGDPENSGMGGTWSGWENWIGHPYERDSIVRVV